jgi:ribosomal protein S18 acetylase RimI-like enzyme
MTEAVADTGTRAPAPVTIRAYRPTDHGACRALWAQLVERDRDLYHDPTLGGSDAGAGFEEHLTRLDLTGMWVAEDRTGAVLGMVGLLIDGRAGQLSPVVVAEGHRRRGIGRAMLDFVAAEARRRDLRRLRITPPTGNVEAIGCFHAAGYDNLSNVTLTLDVGARARTGGGEMDLHGLRFSY